MKSCTRLSVQYQYPFISRGKTWVVSYCTNRHTKKTYTQPEQNMFFLLNTHMQKNRNILITSSNQAQTFKYALQHKILLGSCLQNFPF